MNETGLRLDKSGLKSIKMDWHWLPDDRSIVQKGSKSRRGQFLGDELNEMKNKKINSNFKSSYLKTVVHI